MNIKLMIKNMPPFRSLVRQRDEYYYKTLNLEKDLEEQRNMTWYLQEAMDSIRESQKAVQSSIDSLYKFYEKNNISVKAKSYECGLLGLYDNSFIAANENGLVVRIPIELLFTEKSDDSVKKCENITDSWLKQNHFYANIPVLKLKPHKKLFEYFIKGIDLPEDYYNWYMNLFYTRNQQPIMSIEALISKRYEEFVFMQNSLNNSGMEFFEKQPPVAVWNEKGYFNLLDGHHRTMFLIESGFRFIPVQISEHDYDKWRNDEIAIEFKRYIMESKRDEYYTPIYNPFFMNISSYRDNVSPSRLYHILKYMQDMRINGLNVLDIGSCLSYISQHFFREGANVTCIEPNKNHVETAKILQKLLHTNCKIHNCSIQEYTTNQTFDICILLTIFYHFYSVPSIRDKFIDIINTHVNLLLIWESGEDFDNERQYLLEHTKFKKFTHLAYTYGTGKMRELGVFSL